MTAFFAPKIWFWPFVLRYLAFPGWMITSPKRQNGYLNQRIILFRLQYETHSLQMYPKSPCSYVITLTPKSSERRYALRLVVVPCQYLPSLLPSFQPILPSVLSHISYVAARISSAALSIPVVLNLLHRACPLLSSPLTLYAIPIILHLHRASVVILPRLCYSPHRIIFHRHVYFAAVVCLPSWIGSSPRSPSLCTTLLAPLWSALLYSLSALIFSLRFSLLFWDGSSLYPWCSHSAPICCVFSPLAFTTLCSNLIIPISSVFSDLLSPYLICSTLIFQLMIWYDCSDLLGSARPDLLCLLFLWNF